MLFAPTNDVRKSVIGKGHHVNGIHIRAKSFVTVCGRKALNVFSPNAPNGAVRYREQDDAFRLRDPMHLVNRDKRFIEVLHGFATQNNIKGT